MARLFLTQRELNFISDINKELIKDVIGQRIFYYPISELKTKVHSVYNESIRKVFDNPIELDALVDSNFQSDTKIDQFGVDAQYRLEVFIQHRDLIEKGFNPAIGDFFSFSSVFYEITDLVFTKSIYGLPEHKAGIKLTGIKSRESLFNAPLQGPTDYSDPAEGAVQVEFEQQRGFEENGAGPTGDVRDLVRQGVLDPPISGPRKISQSPTPAGPSFYDED
jgi:hypothetical protein